MTFKGENTFQIGIGILNFIHKVNNKNQEGTNLCIYKDCLYYFVDEINFSAGMWSINNSELLKSKQWKQDKRCL